MGQTSYMQCKTASFFHYWQQNDTNVLLVLWNCFPEPTFIGLCYSRYHCGLDIYKFKPTPLCKSHFMHMMFPYQNYLPSLVVIPFFLVASVVRCNCFLVSDLWTSLCQIHNSTVISFNRKSNNQLPSLVLKIYLVFKLSGTIIQWINLSILEITCARRKLHNGIQINYLSCIRYYISAHRINHEVGWN